MAALVATSVLGWVLVVCAIGIAVAGVIWLLIDVLRRPDFSGGKKLLWVVAALLFSLATLVVYVAFFRGWDDPLKRDD